MEDTKKLMTTAMLLTVAAVLSLLLYIVPFLQAGLFIIAIPMTVIGVKYDWKYQLLALLALTFLLMTLDPFYAIYVLLLVGPLTVAQGYTLHRKKTDSEVVFLGTIAMVFGLLALMYLSSAFMDMNIMEEMKTMTSEVVDQVKGIYSTTDVLENSELQNYIDNLESMKDSIILLMPSLMILFGLYTSIFSFIVTKAVFKRIGMAIPKRYFKDFRIDKHMRFYLILVMLLISVAALFDKVNLEFYLMNSMTVLFLILQINGFALIWYLTQNHPNKKALRFISIVLYIISPMIAVAELVARFGLAILGFVDTYADLRMRISQRKQS